MGRSAIGGTDEVDDRLFRRADKPCRTHDDLNDVHRRSRTLVQVDPEVAGEVVEDQVAAIERLQQQEPASDRRLRFARRRSEHQQAHQRGASQSVTSAGHLPPQLSKPSADQYTSSCAMRDYQMVARGGIEPPTRGFSVAGHHHSGSFSFLRNAL